MADEIVSIYRMDVQQWEAGKEEIRKGSAELVASNKQTQTSFNDLSKKSAQAFSTDKVQQFGKEAGKALKDTKKEADNLTASTKGTGNAFLAMRKELKNVQGQLTALAANGRENSKLFKALSSEAGKLKDRMKDLGSTIELQAGDPLENLSTGVGQLKGSIANLDFEGAARALGGLGANIGKIDLKTLKDGIGGVISGFGKLAGAIFSSPIFLIGAAIAGIIAIIATWGESLEEIRAKNDRLIAGIDRRLSITQAGYDREIRLLNASGEATDKVEKEKLNDFIDATEKKIKLRQKEFDFEIRHSALARKLLGKDKFQEVIDASEINKELTELQIALDDARSGLREVDLKKETEANKIRDDQNKKANEDYKKHLEEKYKIALDAFKQLSDTQRFFESEEAAKWTAEGQKKIDDILAKAFPERKKKTQSALEDARDLINEETVKTANDEKKSSEERQSALDESLRLNLVSQQEALDIQKDINLQSIAEKQRQLDATVKFGNDLISIGESFAQIARNMGMENAEAEKALAVFGVAVNLAQALGNVILGATAASLQTGPLAPFTLVAYIASGTAAVLGAFAQVTSILSQEPPSFAEGGYTGDGGKYAPAGTVHKGEWVSTQSTTNKYWEELEAMHNGGFQDLLMYKYIGPALDHAIRESDNQKQLGFADNIANSMLMNGMFKDGNILNALMKGNNDEGKRHREVISTLYKTGNKRVFRKK